MVAALFAAVTISASALTPAQTRAIDKAVSTAKVLKVPAVASELVVKASATDRQDIVVQVIRSTKSFKAGALIQTVSAISKACPEMASVAASTAASFSKSSAAKIAKTAIKAAPAYEAAIVAEVSEVAPEYAEVINAVAASTPTVTFGEIQGKDVSTIPALPIVLEDGADPSRKPYTAP